MLGSRTNQRGTERNRISSSLGTAPVPHVAAEPNPVSLTRVCSFLKVSNIIRTFC